MRKKDISSKMFPKKNEEEFDEERNRLAKQLIDIRTWLLKNNQFEYDNPDECFNLMLKNTINMENNVYNLLSKHEFRSIAKSFVSRFVNQILIVATHNAILRKSSKINTSDIQNATDMFSRLFEQLCLWIEQNIDENKLMKKQRRSFTMYVREWFKLKNTYTVSEFAHLIAERAGYSESYAYELIKNYAQGDKAIIKKEKGLITRA